MKTNASEWHGVDVLLDRIIRCEYAGKARQGKVVKANGKNLTIEYTNDVGKPEFRTLSHDKIEKMTIQGF